MLKRYIALAFAAVALTAAACGDDDGDAASGSSVEPAATTEQTSGSGPTKVQFLKEASDICLREREKLAKEAIAFGNRAAEKDPSVQEEKYFPPLVRQVILPSILRLLDQLRELEVPAGDELRVEAIFASLEQTVNDEAADPTRGSEGLRERFNTPRRLATEYGLSNCVYP